MTDSSRTGAPHMPPPVTPSVYTTARNVKDSKPKGRAVDRRPSKPPVIIPSPCRFLRCAVIDLIGPRRQGRLGYIADIGEYFPSASQREAVAAKGLTYQGLPLIVVMVGAPIAVNVICYMIWPYFSLHFILANLLILGAIPLAAQGRDGGYARLFAPFFFERPDEHRRRIGTEKPRPAPKHRKRTR